MTDSANQDTCSSIYGYVSVGVCVGGGWVRVCMCVCRGGLGTCVCMCVGTYSIYGGYKSPRVCMGCKLLYGLVKVFLV